MDYQKDFLISFSIVIVNYNTGKYLEDAIKSIINQDYPKLQLIIIDGGSTDNSIEIIKNYENYIDYWISEKDKGQSDAFNKGFSKAKNEWLFWLNADDFLLKDSLHKLNKRICKALQKDSSLKWFCFDSIMTDKYGNGIVAYYGPQYNKFFMKKLGPQIHSATSIFHKDLFYQSKGFDIKLNWSMDLDLWIQFHKLKYKYKTIHEFCYATRINEGSKTLSNGLKMIRTEEHWKQSGYMYKKNNFFVDRNYLNPWRLYKLFTNYPKKIIYTYKFKGKDLIWFN